MREDADPIFFMSLEDIIILILLSLLAVIQCFSDWY